MSDKNTWIDFAEVEKVIADAKAEKWSWMNNNNCKYLNLRIDMRDGHCLIRNRDGEAISLDELKYQFELK